MCGDARQESWETICGGLRLYVWASHRRDSGLGWATHRYWKSATDKSKDTNGRKNGCVAGHAGVDDPQDAGSDGAFAWLRDRAAHRADQWGPACGELRHVVSRDVETGAGGTH